MTQDDKRILGAGAKPLLTTFLYGVILLAVGLLHPEIPKSTALVLAAVFIALLGWTGDVFFRVATGPETPKDRNARAYRLLIWGNRLAFGSLALSILLRGLGLSRSCVLIGLGIAMVGTAVLTAGGVWAMPGEMRVWRVGRQAKRGQ
jgi:protein-S-isoprenylcysteine O-methyltransferase Ste14